MRRRYIHAHVPHDGGQPVRVKGKLPTGIRNEDGEVRGGKQEVRRRCHVEAVHDTVDDREPWADEAVDGRRNNNNNDYD